MKNNIDESKIKMIIHSIGLKYNLQDQIVSKIVNSPYKFTRKTISELDLKDIETEEEFNKLKTNFIYRYIGKLHISYAKYKQRTKLEEGLDNFNKK